MEFTPESLDLASSFSISSLMAGILFGTVGLYLFRQGRKNQNISWAVIGVLLMVYSMFTSNPWADWGIGFLLCGVAYLKRYD